MVRGETPGKSALRRIRCHRRMNCSVVRVSVALLVNIESALINVERVFQDYRVPTMSVVSV